FALRTPPCSTLSPYTTLFRSDPELAHRVGAHGVHLGQEDWELKKARGLLGPEAIIGITCHHRLDLARAATISGADYLAFGRFYTDRKSTRLNSSHVKISYAVF